MLVIPFRVPPESGRGPFVIVMILEKENLDRMREADPFDLKFAAYPTEVIPPEVAARDLDIVIAYEEDTNTLMDFQKRQDIAGLMKWLERGRKIVAGDLHRPFKLRKQ
jgi:hypothetical protein